MIKIQYNLIFVLLDINVPAVLPNDPAYNRDNIHSNVIVVENNLSKLRDDVSEITGRVDSIEHSISILVTEVGRLSKLMNLIIKHLKIDPDEDEQTIVRV